MNKKKEARTDEFEWEIELIQWVLSANNLTIYTFYKITKPLDSTNFSRWSSKTSKLSKIDNSIPDSPHFITEWIDSYNEYNCHFCIKISAPSLVTHLSLVFDAPDSLSRDSSQPPLYSFLTPSNNSDYSSPWHFYTPLPDIDHHT